MVTFRDAVADSLKGALCAIIALNDDGARLWGRYIPALAGPADYFNFFAPLRADLCNEDPRDQPTPNPPFSGGQCNEKYIVSYVLNEGGANPSDGTFLTLGPLGGFVEEEQSNGSVFVFFRSNSNLIFGGQCFNITSGNSPRNNFVGSYTPDEGTGPRVLSVTPCGSDACGDPPIPPPPPGPITRPINVTFNNEDNDIIDIDGDVTFSPVFSTGDLNITAPFRLNLGGVNFSGEVQISPNFELRIAPSFSFGGGGFADPTPIPPRDPTEPTPPEPEPAEPVIIGVIVRSQLVGEQRATSIATENIPTIFAPRLGSVSFAINAGLVSAWTPDIDIKNRDCYIPCPAPQGAVAVAATAAPGVTLTWVPVRGKPLLDLTS